MERDARVRAGREDAPADPAAAGLGGVGMIVIVAAPGSGDGVTGASDPLATCVSAVLRDAGRPTPRRSPVDAVDRT